MTGIKNLKWNCELSLTSNQVEQLARLKTFAGNIKGHLTDKFEEARHIQWEEVNAVLHEVNRLYNAHKEAQISLGKVLNSINKDL